MAVLLSQQDYKYELFMARIILRVLCEISHRILQCWQFPIKPAFFCAKMTLRNVETRHNSNAYH